MHKEILTKEQIDFLPLVKLFSKEFGLVGGTAIALHIGHRSSIDFDLFNNEEFSNSSIRRKLKENIKIDNIVVDNVDELTLVAKGVKFTFFHYPYKIEYSDKLNNTIKISDLLTLSAMKAFALEHGAKWKDYVDLYFVIKDYCNINKIIEKAKQIFFLRV